MRTTPNTRIDAKVRVLRTIRVDLELDSVIADLPNDLTTQDRVELVLNIPEGRSRVIALTDQQLVHIVGLKGYRDRLGEFD